MIDWEDDHVNAEHNGHGILKFTLTRETIPFFMDDKEGVAQAYVLRELDGTERDGYQSWLKQKGAVKFNTEGKPVMENATGVMAELLQRHIWTGVLDDDKIPQFKQGVSQRLPVADIQAWPAKVQNALFREAATLSGLDARAEDNAAKN
jgi:hypothetical protein